MDTEQIVKQIEALQSGLDALRQMVLEKMPQFPKDKQHLVDTEVCLGCGEHRATKKGRWLRGNHESCYRGLMREIEAGELTEFEAVEQGLLKPVEITGRPRAKSAVRDYLSKKNRTEPTKRAKRDISG